MDVIENNHLTFSYSEHRIFEDEEVQMNNVTQHQTEVRLLYA